MISKRKWLWSATLALALCFIMAAVGMASTATPAGTVISNQAVAKFKDLSNKQQEVVSNVVYVTVKHVPGVEVYPEDPATVYVGAGQQVQYAFQVKNTGNGPDTFDITGDATGTVTQPPGVTYHLDVNGNGVIDGSESLLVSAVGPLAPGEAVTVIASFTVPPSASSGDSVEVVMKATSTVDSSVTDASGKMTFKVVDTNVITATLAVDLAEADPEDTLNYTVTVKNVGQNIIDTLRIELPVPDNTTTTGVVTVNGVDKGTNGGHVDVENIPVDGVVVVVYKVKVDANASVGYITNTVDYEISSASPAVEGQTNEVRTLIRRKAGVALKQVSGNIYDVTSVDAGATYSFPYEVENTGNADDVFYLDASIAPDNWPVALYGADGVTPLPKVNGRYTVGSLAAGAKARIVTRVTVPVNVDNGASGPWTVTTTATSQADSTKSASKDATLNNVKGAGVTVTVGDPKSQPAKPGEAVEFDVTVSNTGPAPDTFRLKDDFPDGYGVEYVDDQGNPVTELAIEAGSDQKIKIRVTVPSGAKPGDVDGKITATSTNNATASNSDTATIEVQVLIAVSIAPSQSGVVDLGLHVDYTLHLKNSGNTAHQVHINFAAAGASPLLRYAVREDTAWWDDLTTTVEPNETKQLTVRVWADHGAAPAGWTDVVNVTAYLGEDSSADVADAAQLSTLVNGAQLRLQKTVNENERNPGENIVYTVTATNISAGTLTDVEVWDAVPQHTTFVSAATTKPTTGVTLEYSDDHGVNWEADPGDLGGAVTTVKWFLDSLASLVDNVLEVTLTVKVK